MIKSILIVLLFLSITATMPRVLASDDNSRNDSSAAENLGNKSNKANILLITADDLNWNSIGVYGSQVPDISPNIDSFAKQGVRFSHAHVTVAVCTVSRGVLATGLYPHQSGIDGFYHTDKDIPTIISTLRENGYLTAIKGKVDHSSPKFDTKWDMVYRKSPAKGRDKKRYYQFVRDVVQNAKKQNKPFYIMANSHDPHRPFAGSFEEKQKGMAGKVPPPSRTYTADEVAVPGFLPQLPKIAQEIAEYTSSVKRFDDTVGAILKALEEEGVADNTIVTLLSDNGMAVPFAKSNAYLNSTKTPWIVRWPEHIKTNYIDDEHLISGIDFFPTMLDAVGIEIPSSLAGRSFLPLLKGEKQPDRTHVYTMYYETSSGAAYPMRVIQDRQFSYIFNPWSDQKYRLKNQGEIGLTWKAMVKAAKTDKEISKRAQFYKYRSLEEFYDYKSDPNALNNLIEHPDYEEKIEEKRAMLRQWMVEYEDPVLYLFDGREDQEKLKEYMKSIRSEATEKFNKRKRKKGQEKGEL
jgi:N-sulfoglucosamine sulfohydrolase